MSDAVDVAIGVDKGQVVMEWHAPLTRYEMDPKNAYQIGIALGRAALQAHDGSVRDVSRDTQFIEGELRQMRVTVNDFQRMALIMKVATIVRSLTDQKRAAGYIAQHCVDAVLQETAR